MNWWCFKSIYLYAVCIKQSLRTSKHTQAQTQSLQWMRAYRMNEWMNEWKIVTTTRRLFEIKIGNSLECVRTYFIHQVKNHILLQHRDSLKFISAINVTQTCKLKLIEKWIGLHYSVSVGNVIFWITRRKWTPFSYNHKCSESWVEEMLVCCKKSLLHVQSLWNQKRESTLTFQESFSLSLSRFGQFFPTGDFISSVHDSAHNSTHNLHRFIFAPNFIKSLLSHLWPYCVLFVQQKNIFILQASTQKHTYARPEFIPFMWLLMITQNVNLQTHKNKRRQNCRDKRYVSCANNSIFGNVVPAVT